MTSAWKRAGAALVAGLATACGGDGGGTAIDLDVAPGSDGDQLVVAEVNGTPVYADCVVTQAQAKQVSKEAALAECIDFELLAQAANERGLGDTGEVARVREREAVRRFVEVAFEERIATPDDVPDDLLDKAYQAQKDRFQHPEWRQAVYLRAPAEDVPAGGEVDRAAKALMEEIHTRLAGETELTAKELYAIGAEVASGRALEEGPPFKFPRRGKAVPAFADAAFAVPEVGMVSPPFRTRWGWDIVLVTKIWPAVDKSPEEAREELFAGLRQVLFRRWLEAIVPADAIEVDEAWLARLAQVDLAKQRGELIEVESP